MSRASIPLVVLGNDPSVRGFDIRRLSVVHSVGMNAAYHFWNKIDWFPTYYCCLDRELIKSHSDAIANMVYSGRIRRFFLTASIIELVPGLSKSPNIDFLDEYLEDWWEEFGRKHGLARKESPYILSKYPEKSTTASYAVRWALHLGYRRIGLLGIDCGYNALPEWVAGSSSDIAIEMRSTPTHNPNYFFDGYQGAGDKLNITNPAVHNGNLHLQTFEALREDLLITRDDVYLRNLNSESELHRQGVFPYQTIEEFLGEQPLSAVVCPLSLKELSRAIEHLRLWDQPEYTPYQTLPKAPTVDLVFSFNVASDLAVTAQLEAAFQGTTHVKHAFRSLQVMFCGLTAEQDVYNRAATGAPPQRGYKAGPNNLFFETMRQMKTTAPYVFLMETDCFPTRPGWLREVEDVCRRYEGAWIIGSFYRGLGPMNRFILRHINGNAIYGIGLPDFNDFLWNTFRPWLDDFVENTDPLVAYDCGWDLFIQQAKSDDANDPVWLHARNCLGKFQFTDVIVNVAGGSELRGESLWSLGDIRQQFPGCAVVHGPVSREAVPAQKSLRQPPSFEEFSLGPWSAPKQSDVYFHRFFATGRAEVVCKHKGIVQGQERDYLCIAFGLRRRPFMPGDIIEARLAIRADQEVAARVMIARQGTGKLEKTDQYVFLSSQSTTLTLRHRVKTQHELFRVQIGPRGVWPMPVTISFDEATIEVTRNNSILGRLNRPGFTLPSKDPNRTDSQIGRYLERKHPVFARMYRFAMWCAALASFRRRSS